MCQHFVSEMATFPTRTYRERLLHAEPEERLGSDMTRCAAKYRYNAIRLAVTCNESCDYGSFIGYIQRMLRSSSCLFPSS